MASELKVDKIFNAGGDQDSGINLATNDTIKFDIATSTKATMASTGIVTIVGEGGTTTTNLQQGLAKLWCKFDQVNSNAINDSFNLSSVTDTATGKYSLNFTNNMANDDYSTVGTSHYTANYYGLSSGPHTDDGLSTSLYAMRTVTPNNATLADMSEISDSVFGDLA